MIRRRRLFSQSMTLLLMTVYIRCQLEIRRQLLSVMTRRLCQPIMLRVEQLGAFLLGRVDDDAYCGLQAMHDYQHIARLHYCQQFAALRVTRQPRRVLCVPASTTLLCLLEPIFLRWRELLSLIRRFIRFSRSVQASNIHFLIYVATIASVKFE